MENFKSQPFRTVLTITVGFLILYWFFQAEWMLYVAIGLGLIGVCSTFLSKQIEFLWMKLAWVLSLIVPNILLSVVFFIILCPIAFLSRIFKGGDPLRLKREGESMFKDVDKRFEKARFENPW